MSTPRIWVRHMRYKNHIRIAAYREGVDGAIFVEDIPPINTKQLSKFKLTVKNALKLRYEK